MLLIFSLYDPYPTQKEGWKFVFYCSGLQSGVRAHKSGMQDHPMGCEKTGLGLLIVLTKQK